MKTEAMISAKTLGELALPDFCPRCFWVRLKAGTRLPFQIFPGIFSFIDSYTKSVVHGWFDRHGTPPEWLTDLGDITGYKEPPHWSNFSILDEKTGVRLRGCPDAVFTCPEGTYVIADYKTATYTQAQDELLPLYEVQLNAYAFIGRNNGLSPVSALALIYTEPVTDKDAASSDTNCIDSGFRMEFSARVHPVNLDVGTIPPLLAMAREIHELGTPPPPTTGCKNCENLDALARLLQMDGNAGKKPASIEAEVSTKLSYYLGNL